MSKFKVGDRVRVHSSEARNWKSPWDKRFASGREGTVIAIMSDDRWAPVRVQWDMKGRGKEYDFRLSMRDSDLELVQ